MSTTLDTRSETTADDVVRFLNTCTDMTVLRTIARQASHRQKQVETRAAAAAEIGTRVTLAGLSPQYLNGLTGTIDSRSTRGKARVDIRLDAASTAALRSRNTSRFYIAPSAETYVVHGVPIDCAKTA